MAAFCHYECSLYILRHSRSGLASYDLPLMMLPCPPKGTSAHRRRLAVIYDHFATPGFTIFSCRRKIYHARALMPSKLLCRGLYSMMMMRDVFSITAWA